VSLLSRHEAAAKCRVSLATFDRHVARHLTPKRIGRRVLYREKDLDEWLDEDRDPPREDERRASPSVPASRGNLAFLNDPRVQQMASELRAKRARRPVPPPAAKG
jgi:predicted DNA-binding transcriptional regulator AlpA